MGVKSHFMFLLNPKSPVVQKLWVRGQGRQPTTWHLTWTRSFKVLWPCALFHVMVHYPTDLKRQVSKMSLFYMGADEALPCMPKLFEEKYTESCWQISAGRCGHLFCTFMCSSMWQKTGRVSQHCYQSKVVDLSNSLKSNLTKFNHAGYSAFCLLRLCPCTEVWPMCLVTHTKGQE